MDRRTLLLASSAAVLGVVANAQPLPVLSDTVPPRRGPGPLWTGVPLGASLDLSFVNPGTLDPRLTFTRGSTATYFNSAGVMQTAAVNAPRWDYNPSTHALNGLLMEEARTNSVTHSATLADHTVTAATRTLNVTAAPDGTTTGTLLTEDGTNAEHYMDFLFVPTGSTTYTGSCFVKANTRTQVAIQGRVAGNWAGGNAEVLADLSLGTVAVLAGTPTATITPVGNGWFRITFTANSTASPAGNSFFRVALANGGQILYQGNGTGSAYFWGCQLEAGAFPTSYIPTTSAAVTRAQDVVSILPASMGFYVAPGGSWFVEFIAKGPPPAGINLLLIPQHGNQAAPLPMFLANNGQLGQWDGTAVIATTTIVAAGNLGKGATTWAGGVGTCCLNGGPVASAATPNGYPALASAGVDFLATSEGVNTNMTGYLRRVRYWRRVLSNAEMQSVTR